MERELMHRLIVVVLGISLVASSSLNAAPRPTPVSRCADGACVPKRNTFGYHAGGWRKWPGGKSSSGDSRSESRKPAPLKDLPTVELPDPKHEDSADQPLAPPRSDQEAPVALPALPQAAPKPIDPAPLPPIDPEDAPPGLPKTMQELEPTPKPPGGPLNELFKNTPLPEQLPTPQSDGSAGSAQAALGAGMPLTIFRPSAKAAQDGTTLGESLTRSNASNTASLTVATKRRVSKDDSLPGRYVAGVFLPSDKLAKVSKSKKSDSASRWTNPLRSGEGEESGVAGPSGFVAKVFSPPRRIDRAVPDIENLSGGPTQPRESNEDSSKLELAEKSSPVPQNESNEFSENNAQREPARALASSEGLSNLNPLRESVRRDQYVKPVSYEESSSSKSVQAVPQRSNPLRSGR